jgi:hypothetical protein
MSRGSPQAVTYRTLPLTILMNFDTDTFGNAIGTPTSLPVQQPYASQGITFRPNVGAWGGPNGPPPYAYWPCAQDTWITPCIARSPVNVITNQTFDGQYITNPFVIDPNPVTVDCGSPIAEVSIFTLLTSPQSPPPQLKSGEIQGLPYLIAYDEHGKQIGTPAIYPLDKLPGQDQTDWTTGVWQQLSVSTGQKNSIYSFSFSTALYNGTALYTAYFDCLSIQRILTYRWPPYKIPGTPNENLEADLK